MTQTNLRSTVKEVFICTFLFFMVATLSGCESFTRYYFVNKTEVPVNLRAKVDVAYPKREINTTVEPNEELYIGLAGFGKHKVDIDMILSSLDKFTITDLDGALLLDKSTLNSGNLTFKGGAFYSHYYLTVWPSDLETTEEP